MANNYIQIYDNYATRNAVIGVLDVDVPDENAPDENGFNNHAEYEFIDCNGNSLHTGSLNFLNAHGDYQTNLNRFKRLLEYKLERLTDSKGKLVDDCMEKLFGGLEDEQ